MEEEKAAAYYDELTRKGSGAARFKQGLGFSSDKDDAVPTKGSVLSSSSSSSSSSFLSKFVKASSPTKSSQLEKQAQLSSIQNKLKKNPEERGQSRDSEGRSRERDHRERHSKRRSRSRSRSRSRERHRDRDRDRDRHRERRRSVERRRSEKNGEREKAGKEERIQGFDKMSPAERVKAKMKLQLAETAEKDASMGMGSGWERFEFDKDAPLDDEEIEAVEDDAALVKHIGQSFRFSAIEARREEKIKAAHDEAMFGASTFQPSVTTDSEPEVDNNKKESNESGLATSLLSEKVLAKQQGSWRDRARKG